MEQAEAETSRALKTLKNIQHSPVEDTTEEKVVEMVGSETESLPKSRKTLSKYQLVNDFAVIIKDDLLTKKSNPPFPKETRVEKKIYECAVCCKVFLKRASLRDHMNRHTRQRVFFQQSNLTTPHDLNPQANIRFGNEKVV